MAASLRQCLALLAPVPPAAGAAALLLEAMRLPTAVRLVVACAGSVVALQIYISLETSPSSFWGCCMLLTAVALVARWLLSGANVQAESTIPTIPSQTPGSGRAKCYHGLRVVELATVVAVPSLGRTMAEHGAEVIKVEDPKGDMWRKFFLEYEGERGTEPGFSSCFESVNLSKYSVVIDLKKPDGVAQLKQILREADVFLTNVRPSGLRRLGLDYDSLRHEYPSLIMAQVLLTPHHTRKAGLYSPSTYLPREQHPPLILRCVDTL